MGRAQQGAPKQQIKETEKEYEKAATMNKEQGLEQAATTTKALADEVKQILSYIKE